MAQRSSLHHTGRQAHRATANRPPRSQCVRVRASVTQVPTTTPSSSRVSRRELLLGTSAAAVFGLVSSTAGRAAADEETVSAAAKAAAAPAAQPELAAAPVIAAEPAISQKVTQEGAVKLMTNNQATRNMTPTDKQIFSLNKRVQAQNRAPNDFPGFIREGFDISVVGEGYVMDQDGLIYKDFVEGSGSQPVDGQQVVFDYTAYNESGAVIDSSYRKGQPAQTRLGIQGLIPGFEMGIRGMKPGGKRRIVVPPALGPPVGPSTFFSAKQCEVFDVELRKVQKCERRQMMMFSDVVCE